MGKVETRKRGTGEKGKMGKGERGKGERNIDEMMSSFDDVTKRSKEQKQNDPKECPTTAVIFFSWRTNKRHTE